ncbi:VIT1/CCC1 family protein [Herbiconiux sp. CPCC 203407]|uniref:VIT1/CCC1 family protein n=1 Tax=Herbiconiux oxytropis TaxID=2970915 RepID=A0AA41XI89_9MICO|nr:VIT1/CCC1 family protein [Herbiconiux oxytropis]MCS5722209.1 VIT1/CCC1 family protein [Herbiconiux oxytropis]MCS5727153.1 VIT1/CCC1 family protein [Herbiconiux oxytropis]
MTSPSFSAPASGPSPSSGPSAADLRRWRQYLADERAEAQVYRELAQRRTGSERAILEALADAEGRHESHWLELLGDDVGKPRRADVRTRLLGVFARRFGSVFVLALMQRAEARSPYDTDDDATAAMAADERIHGEVVRGLAAKGRSRLSGTFRAAVFGANDGLVSNLALVLGIGATGVPAGVVLATGVAGLLAGALSMGAGEFVSVRSQRELLAASTPDPSASTAVPLLDVDANELALVYRARGMSQEAAEARALDVFGGLTTATSAIRLPRAGDAGITAPGSEGPAGGGALGTGTGSLSLASDEHEEIGTAWQAAFSSFCFFASGAIIPVLPYLFGLTGLPAVLVASALVGLALLGTGAVVGLLSGGPPLRRALRQLAIGYGAAAVTYLLGLLFGASLG